MERVKLYLRQHTDTTAGIVWVSFYLLRKKVNFSTKVKCWAKDWNASKEKVGSGDKNHADKNLILESVRARINNVFVKYRLKDKTLTRDIFLRAYNRPDDYDTFFAFVSDYQRNNKGRIELSTWDVHRSVLRKVEQYAPMLHLEDITTEWLDRYYAYLRKDLGNNDNTAYKNLSVIRKYVNAAYKRGHIDENPFHEWSIKRTTASYSFLTEPELLTASGAYKEGRFDADLHQTLEFFLFLCYSSLHVGDARQIMLEQFGEDSFTYYRIKNRNSKPLPIRVPMSEALRTVVRNVAGSRTKGLLFSNLPADQTINKRLKRISAELELPVGKAISMKTGRHTFATYFLRKTKDLTALKEILGHSELRETLIYAHVLDEAKHEGVKHFDVFA